MDPAQIVSNPAVGVGLRAALGSYVIYMARKFYADPTGYFRKSQVQRTDLRWLRPIIRAVALFCLWGGCFIVATAVAVQILGLHGDLLAIVLIAVAAAGAWLLLPRQRAAEAETESGTSD